MFTTKDRVLKNITVSEIIELLKDKELTIEDLNNLKTIIISKLNNKNKKELEIDFDYKSFKARDFSLTKNDKIISFIINKSGLLLGTDEYLTFYVGKVDKNLNMILFDFPSNYYSYLVFKGNFESNCNCYYGDCWCSENATGNILDEFDFSNCNDIIYNNIIEQEIPDIKMLIQLAYQNQSNNKKNIIDTILSVLNNNNKIENKSLKRENNKKSKNL